MKSLPAHIQTRSDLLTLIDHARKMDAVAMDTEFVWERTYYPQLGLIQIALSDEDCFLIDPLAIDDLSPLGELLSDRSVIKIFHDAPQDLTIITRATGAVTQNIFDTRLAAGFSGFPATLSLCHLIRELLEIILPKKETKTNWLKRPLTESQIDYALDDVRYLRAIRVLLLNRIIGPKVKAWLQEELNLLNNPANYDVFSESPYSRYKKIKGTSGLDRQGLAILKSITSWREGMARKKDRPRGHIIPDKILVEIASTKPATIDAIKADTTISEKGLKRYGTAITAIVAKTCSQPEENYPVKKKTIRLTQTEKTRFNKLNDLIKLKSDLLGLDPALIGNSAELKKLARILSTGGQTDKSDMRQTEGWRKHFLNEFLCQKQESTNP